MTWSLQKKSEKESSGALFEQTNFIFDFKLSLS